MMWRLSHRAARRALPIADGHYSRQKPGTPQFVAPGRCIVLITGDADALWVSSWPFAEYVKHAWAGAWMCSFFRRLPHCPHRASDLIGPAIAATRDGWGDAPTFGYCYLKAGFTQARCPKHDAAEKGCHACQGLTKDGLIALQMLADRMPPAEPAFGTQASLFGRP
jgi:hypothetical protein